MRKKLNGKNIVLIGMPGVGKSSAGIVLAKRIGYRFIDVDILIQEQEGMLLKEIIAAKGHDGFLEVENQVNRDIDAVCSVIATGGSAVYCTEAMENYKKNCLIIYLRCPYPVLEKRLGDLKERGVALKDGQTLRSLYDERSILYEKYADIIVDEGRGGIKETIDLLKEELAKLEA